MTNAVLTRPSALPAAAAASRPGAAAGQTATAFGQLGFTKDALRIIMFLAILLNISRFHQAYPLLAKLRPGLVLIAAAVLYAGLNPRSLARGNIFAHWPTRRMVTLGIIACGSCAFGISLGKSANFIVNNYSKTMLFAFVVAVSIRDARDLFTYVWSFALSCGILAYFSLVVFGLSKSYGSETERLGGMYTYDANDVCVVLLVGLASVLLLFVTSKKLLARGVLTAILVFIGGTMARSGSRGGFLGLLAFVVGALLLVNTVSVASRGSLVLVLAGGLLFFAPKGYWKQMNTILSPTADYNFDSLDGRRELALRGFQYMLEYPLFGVGISNFDRAECTLSGIETGHNGIRCSAPHNSYVEAAAEIGVPGLLVYLSMILGGIVAMLKLRKKLPRSWRRGNDVERFLYNCTTFFALGLIGFAVSSFFVSFAWLDLIYVQIALVGGLYAAVNSYQHQLTWANVGGGVEERPVASRDMAGWRVLRSAGRGAAAQRFAAQARTR